MNCRILSTSMCSLVIMFAALSFSGCQTETATKDDATTTGKADSSKKADASTAQQKVPVSTGDDNHAAFYTVAHYDAEADPAEQLKETLKRAASENKTVLLQVGGDWCGWCKLMTKFIDEHPAISQKLSESFLIQKITYDDKNHNEAFLADYPKIKGYPHIFVLDSHGELLLSKNTEELEEGKGYSENAFVEFLEKWKPASTQK